jgi:hypothetical protein
VDEASEAVKHLLEASTADRSGPAVRTTDLWVPETRAMSCDVLIFVEEAADAVASGDLADPGRCTVGKWP